MCFSASGSRRQRGEPGGIELLVGWDDLQVFAGLEGPGDDGQGAAAQSDSRRPGRRRGDEVATTDLTATMRRRRPFVSATRLAFHFPLSHRLSAVPSLVSFLVLWCPLYDYCHPEPQAKDPAREWGGLRSRRPDPSMRCASFRMTNRAEIHPNPYHMSSVGEGKFSVFDRPVRSEEAGGEVV